MQKTALIVAALALAGCAPALPDSNPEARATGFDRYSNYDGYRADREAALAGEAPAPPPQSPPAAAVLPPAGAVETTALPPQDTAISDEQSFDAVAERETIESDAERVAALAAAYEEVKPAPVPQRTGDEGPNIVAYALATSHPVGTEMHRRNPLLRGRNYERNCAGYVTPDLAQEAFLKTGGPQRDRLGLDPDGDGYACAWDPTPFRRIGG
jgi:hypothetical protein